MTDRTEAAVCPICPRHCALREGQTGACRARVCRDGRVVCGNYGRVTSLALDPIEKKPLRRFRPGSLILSAGSYGCSLACPWCQNAEISARGPETDWTYLSPEALTERALALVPRGNIGLAFTYNEPTVGWEYLMDTAALAVSRGLQTVLVTNGSLCREPLLALLPFIDAMNIDLKGFTPELYRRIGGDLETVRAAIALSQARCHVEVTTLIVPGRNDSEAEMDAEAAWLASLSPELPLHISRFFPRYKLSDVPATPVDTVYRLRDTAARHLRWVYTGNC